MLDRLLLEDHQQIYRELSKLRDRGHVQGREVVQSGKPNKLVYTLTSEGRAALKHWAARPSSPPSIKDDLLVRLYALDSVDIDPPRDDLMARQEHHRDRFARYERILNERFPQRHRIARGYRQIARTAHRPSPRARGCGMVRRGHRCLVRHLQPDQRPAARGRPGQPGVVCRILSIRDGAEVRNPAFAARPPHA
jgi:DNA-binding PadR family transcriptional regulator